MTLLTLIKYTLQIAVIWNRSLTSIFMLWHVVGLSAWFLLNFKTLTIDWTTWFQIFFFSFNCYNLAIHVVTLNGIISTTTRIVRYNILWLEVEKNHFILIFILHNILEPLMGRPFGYSENHYSNSLLMKDFVPFLCSYAHSFIGTYVFLLLWWHMYPWF
jgi:hypothetical protein